MKRSRMKRAGKKTKAWDAERAKLKVRFEAVGITECELRYKDCSVNDFLTFAHTLKRRNVIDLSRVVLACLNCHWETERQGEAKMEVILEDVIASREVQP